MIQNWVSRYNGAGNNIDIASSITADLSGNVYVTGYTKVVALNEDYATIKYNSTGVMQWAQTYNGPSSGTSYDDAYSVAVDLSGNVFVTGFSRNSSNYDIATIKYNSFGILQWVQRYNGPGNGDDGGYKVITDNLGNIFVAGESRGSGSGQDYILIKYNTNGILQWESRYNGTGNSDDIAEDLAIDNYGNLYITGVCGGSGTNADFGTVKYNPSGIQQWVSTYNGGGLNVDHAHALSLDSYGNVYVTGYSSGTDRDYFTIKYNSSGTQQWTQRYNGTGNSFDEPWDIISDSVGNVYVTGQSNQNSSNSDYLTIKYNTNGVQQWVSRFNGPANDIDVAYAITIDKFGGIYVTGQSSGINSNRDYSTIKYNQIGTQIWEARYNGPGNSVDHGKAIYVDAQTNVYVTGLSRGSSNIEDYATIKYIQTPITPISLTATAISDHDIYVQCEVPSNNFTIIDFQYSTDGGITWPWASVSTFSYDTVNNLQPGTIYHFRARATNQSGSSGFSNIAFDTTFWPVGIVPVNNEIPYQFDLLQNYPNPFNPTTQIEFSNPNNNEFIKLTVFDLTGKEVTTLVNQELNTGIYKVDFNGEKLPSGIYFYILETNEFKQTKKMILLK